MIDNNLTISSRSSKLALWQAFRVSEELRNIGINSNIVKIDSTGDVNLKQPIYKLGVSGVFTKELDISLLNRTSDLSVHSLKDVPTKMADGLCIAGVIKRDFHNDIVLYKNDYNELVNKKSVVATGSLRRKSQWLCLYKHHEVINIRGNIQTRLKKFYDNSNLDAIILAEAGLRRINLIPTNYKILDWMIPAPAQGVIAFVCREDNLNVINLCNKITHQKTFITSTIEREFMKTLNGGCSVPISCFAEIKENKVYCVGSIHSLDGSRSVKVKLSTEIIDDFIMIGQRLANEILKEKEARQLLDELRNL